MKLNDLRPLMQETFKGTYRLTGRCIFRPIVTAHSV